MQQMDPEQPLRDQTQHNYGAYQADQEYNRQPHIDPSGPGTFSQSSAKLQPRVSDKASAGQRLALAIVSVALIAALGFAIATNTTASFGSYVVLGIVALAIFLINGFYHRWGVF